MPGISGVDLAIQIKTECPECKILLFSGQTTTQNLLKDARSQGYTFQLLHKPVNPSVVLLNIEAFAVENSLAVRRKAPALSVSPRTLLMPRRTGTSWFIDSQERE
jgi:DNA-binding NtrC family response regulator